jgi:hypothetical protein
MSFRGEVRAYTRGTQTKQDKRFVKSGKLDRAVVYVPLAHSAV